MFVFFMLSFDLCFLQDFASDIYQVEEIILSEKKLLLFFFLMPRI